MQCKIIALNCLIKIQLGSYVCGLSSLQCMDLLSENSDKYTQEIQLHFPMSFTEQNCQTSCIFISRYRYMNTLASIQCQVKSLRAFCWICWAPRWVTLSSVSNHISKPGIVRKLYLPLKSRISLSYDKTYHYIYLLLMIQFTIADQGGWGTEAQWVIRAYLEL